MQLSRSAISAGPRKHPLAVVVLALVFGLAVAGPGFGQENRAPGMPGEVTISDITAHSARISWEPAVDPDGQQLVYFVSLRKRVEGVAQPWVAPQQTRTTSVVWDGLVAGTLYEVKIVASDGRLSGPARIFERGFVTSRETQENLPPSTPRGMEFSQVAAHSVKIWWAASVDPDRDPITYEVSLRKRVEGQVLDWLPAKPTSGTSLVWEGLESETVYDARVRASDGKNVSRWFLRERAFRTPPELNAPGRPGEITVSSVTATSARIAWAAASGPTGVTLYYTVHVRARVEGVALDWRRVAETAELSAVAANLRPGTVYDVRVQAWAKSIGGIPMAKEEAFKTLALAELNHPPSKPGPLEVSELTPFSVRLSWVPSKDEDGDRLMYIVSLRKRIEGVAQAWSPGRETARAGIVWDGLTPRTVYEVRVRAWDGKAASEWLIKEHAFVTPPAGERLASFVRHPDSGNPEDQRTLLVVWPDDRSEAVIESTDLDGEWTRCLEVETDGTNNRTRVPMNTAAKLFRVRR